MDTSEGASKSRLPTTGRSARVAATSGIPGFIAFTTTAAPTPKSSPISRLQTPSGVRSGRTVAALVKKTPQRAKNDAEDEGAKGNNNVPTAADPIPAPAEGINVNGGGVIDGGQLRPKSRLKAPLSFVPREKRKELDQVDGTDVERTNEKRLRQGTPQSTFADSSITEGKSKIENRPFPHPPRQQEEPQQQPLQEPQRQITGSVDPVRTTPLNGMDKSDSAIHTKATGGGAARTMNGQSQPSTRLSSSATSATSATNQSASLITTSTASSMEKSTDSTSTSATGGVSLAARRGRIPTPTGRKPTLGANNKKSSILPGPKTTALPATANQQPAKQSTGPSIASPSVTSPSLPNGKLGGGGTSHSSTASAVAVGKISDVCPAASNNNPTTPSLTSLAKTTAGREEARAYKTAAANTTSLDAVPKRTTATSTITGVINSPSEVNSPSSPSTLSSFATGRTITSSSSSTPTTATTPSSIASSSSSSVTSPAVVVGKMSFMRLPTQPSSGLPGLKKNGGGGVKRMTPPRPGRFPDEPKLDAIGRGERLAEESPLPGGTAQPRSTMKISRMELQSQTAFASTSDYRNPQLQPRQAPASTALPGILPSASANAVVGIVSPMQQRGKAKGTQQVGSVSEAPQRSSLGEANYANLPLTHHNGNEAVEVTTQLSRSRAKAQAAPHAQAAREQYSSSPQLPPPMAPLGLAPQFPTDSMAPSHQQQAVINDRKAAMPAGQRAKKTARAVRDHPRYASYLQRVPRLDATEVGDKGAGKHTAKSTGGSHHQHRDGYDPQQQEFSSPSSSNSSTSISTDELDEEDDLLLSPESNDADELTTTASSAASDYYRYGYNSPTETTATSEKGRKMSIPGVGGSGVNFRRGSSDRETLTSASNAYHSGSPGGRLTANGAPLHSLKNAAHPSSSSQLGQVPHQSIGHHLPKHYYHTVNLSQPGALHYYPSSSSSSIMPTTSSTSSGNRVKVPPGQSMTTGSQRQSHQQSQRILSPVPQQPLAGVGLIYQTSNRGNGGGLKLSQGSQPVHNGGFQYGAQTSQPLYYHQQPGSRPYNSHSLDRNRHLRVFQKPPTNLGAPQVPTSAIPTSPFRFSLVSSNVPGDSTNLSSFLVSPRHQLYGGGANASNGYGVARGSQAHSQHYRFNSRYATLQKQNYPTGVYYPASEAAMDIPHHRSSSLAPSSITGEDRNANGGICRIPLPPEKPYPGSISPLMSKSMVMLQRDPKVFHQQMRTKALESETVVGVTHVQHERQRTSERGRKKNSPYLSGRRTVLSVAPNSELNASPCAFFQLERNGSLSARHPLVSSHNSNGYPSATSSHHGSAHPSLNLHKLSTSANNSLLLHHTNGASERGCGSASVSQGCLAGEMAVNDELFYQNFGTLPMGPGGIGGLHPTADDNGRRHHIYGALSERGGGVAIGSSSNGGRISQLSISSGISALTAATGGGMSSTLMEEKYEFEIAKLHREMDAYRGTISNLTAKHANYGQLIALFDNKLQLMLQHVEKMQKKSQLKKEEITQLNAQIENLRLMSVKAGVNIPAFSDLNDPNTDGTGRQRGLHRALSVEHEHNLNGNDEVRAQLASERSGSGERSRNRHATSKDESNNEAKGKKYGWIRSSFSRAFHKSQSGKKETNAGGRDQSESQQSQKIRTLTIGSPIIAGQRNSSQREEAQRGAGVLAPQEVVGVLKKQLEDKDLALTDVRLDALDKAREVDMLRETVHRLKSENKFLKQNFCIMERRIRDDSLASSHQSLSTCCRGGADNDTDSVLPTYDLVPTSTNSHPSTPARRDTILSTNSSELPSLNNDAGAGMAQGRLDCIRVSLCLEMSGSMESTKHSPPTTTTGSGSLSYGSLSSTANPTPLHSLNRARQGSSSSTISSTHSSGFSSASHPSSNSARSSKQLLTLGFLSPPTDSNTKWSDVDEQLGTLLEEYLHRIDPDMTLGVDSFEAIVGYEIHQLAGDGGNSEDGESFDESRWIRRRDGSTGVWKIGHEAHVEQTKASELLAAPSTTIELRLKGALQESLDVLIMESLLPRSLLDPLLHQLLNSRHRLLIHGSSGVGKSRLARLLARYLSAKFAIPSGSIVDIRFPPEEADDVGRVAQAQQKLVEALKGGGQPGRLIVLDNLPVKRVQAVVEALDEAKSGASPSIDSTCFIIATLNRISEASISPLQTIHAFHLYAMTNRMDAVRSYMTRYLRRRLAEAELNGQCECGERMRHVFEFLTRVLQRVNGLIEKAVASNGSELTIGPRTFLQCPLEADASREWFIELWNTKIAPYMGNNGLRQALPGASRVAVVEDPVSYVCEQWPWLDGVGGERLLRGLENCSKTALSQTPRLHELAEHNNRAQHPARRSTPSHCSSSLSSGYCSSSTVNANHISGNTH